MKRLVVIVLLLFSGTLWAQSGRNVIGAPVYYDTLGNVIGQDAPKDSLYHRPKHHFRNRLEDEFNSLFFELQSQFGGNDLAVGLQGAWLPKRWGFYGSVRSGLRYPYFSVGPALRLSDCGNTIDWHLYGGFVMGGNIRRPGAELGLRMAGKRNDLGFAWSSFSVGAGYLDRQGYITFGLSLSLMPEVLFFLLL